MLLPRLSSIPSLVHPRLQRRALALIAALLLTGQAASHAATTSVAWENLQGTATPASAALYDLDGVTPLSGGATTIGDGAVLALGYFTGATTSAVFDGEWVPLTGPQSANIAFQRTSVGDSTSGTAPTGFFSFQTDFNAANSAVYQRIPPESTRLAVAIYNRDSVGGSTHFNIVTHDAWRWLAPDPVLPTFVFINLTTPGTQWFGGAATAMRTAVATSQFPGNAARAPARLINISTRGFVGTDAAQLIPGFVLQGSGTTRLLIRAVGPTLGLPSGEGGFGLQGALADPAARIARQSDGLDQGTNDDWSQQPTAADVAAAFVTTGAFLLPSGSRDAALLADLDVAPGGYTAVIQGNAAATGVALAEVYLVDTSADAPVELINLSTRGFVGTGDAILIPGFVVGRGGPRRLLIRAAGPTLGARFNLSGTLADPVLRVFAATDPGRVLAENDNWDADGQQAAVDAAGLQAGAFPFHPGARDAALLLQLSAADVERGFTVHVTGSTGATGLVLTEIYALP